MTETKPGTIQQFVDKEDIVSDEVYQRNGRWVEFGVIERKVEKEVVLMMALYPISSPFVDGVSNPVCRVYLSKTDNFAVNFEVAKRRIEERFDKEYPSKE